jgi:hypothetical protein
MVEFIQNPRRSPRAPARCRVGVVSGQGTFEAVTEDVGAHGCQLVSPRLVRKGEPVQLELAHGALKEPLRLAGRVAWASERAPWRLGIAFDESAHEDSTRWFERLLTSVPGLAPFRRIPDRIPVDAAVYLALPPRFLVDFTPDEVALLRSIGSGAAIAELRAQLRERWLPALRALFSLLAHNHVTLSRGGSVHPDAWKKILAEAESSLAVESLVGAEPPPAAPPPRAPPALAGSAAGTRPAMQAVPGPAPSAPSRAATGVWAAAAPMPGPARAAVPAATSAPGPAAWSTAVAPPRTGTWPAAPAPVGPAGSWPAVPAGASWEVAPPAAGWAGTWPDRAPAPTAPPAQAETAPIEPEDQGAPETWLASAAEMMMPTAWSTPQVAPRASERSLDGGAPWASPAQPAPPPPLGPPGSGSMGAAMPGALARSAEAQGCYERALVELQAGRAVGGTALLRRALALAPGDSEIAGALASATGARRAR